MRLKSPFPAALIRAIVAMAVLAAPSPSLEVPSMKLSIKLSTPLLTLALVATSLCAQTPNSQTSNNQTSNSQDGPKTGVIMRDGGVDQTLQSIYIPPLLNAPFTAIVHTEWTRPLAEGGTYTFVNQRRVARDSKGRIYEERWLLAPRGSESQSRMNVIQIADPNAHTLFNYFTLKEPHRCTLETFRDTPQMVYKPAVGTTRVLPDKIGSEVHEDLGMRPIEGIDTHGTRDTINYNSGFMGSDQPFSEHREFWQAPHLGINLYSEVAGPTVGKQVFTLTDVNLAEPDPALFELPEGYSVVDRRSHAPSLYQPAPDR